MSIADLSDCDRKLVDRIQCTGLKDSEFFRHAMRIRCADLTDEARIDSIKQLFPHLPAKDHIVLLNHFKQTEQHLGDLPF